MTMPRELIRTFESIWKYNCYSILKWLYRYNIFSDAETYSDGTIFAWLISVDIPTSKIVYTQYEKQIFATGTWYRM